MALELEYRNTFIDVKEDFEEMGSSRARAQSSPPGRVRRISFSLEAASEEDAMRSYVGTLSQKTAELMKLQDETPTTACSSSPKSPMSPEVMEEPEHPPILAEFFPLLPSQGSLGHPEVCRRPCIYFIAGHCENGNACAYCHMEHTEKTPKLDKRQRTIIQALTRPQLLGLVLHFCRSKAEQAGFLEEAEEILGMLAQESAGARPLSQAVIGPRPPQPPQDTWKDELLQLDRLGDAPVLQPNGQCHAQRGPLGWLLGASPHALPLAGVRQHSDHSLPGSLVALVSFLSFVDSRRVLCGLSRRVVGLRSASSHGDIMGGVLSVA